MVSTRKHTDRHRRLQRNRNSPAAPNSSAETVSNGAHEVSANILLQANDKTQSLREIALTLKHGLADIQNREDYSVSTFKVNEAPGLQGVHLEITAFVPKGSKVEPFFKELLQRILANDTSPSRPSGKNINSAVPLLTAGPSDYVYA